MDKTISVDVVLVALQKSGRIPPEYRRVQGSDLGPGIAFVPFEFLVYDLGNSEKQRIEVLLNTRIISSLQEQGPVNLEPERRWRLVHTTTEKMTADKIELTGGAGPDAHCGILYLVKK